MKDLSGFDLNLLRVFDAVARERHVTRAAARLNLSQPAVSNALNRLRAALGDELFLRAPQGVEPTSLALALMEPVTEVLDRLQETLAATAPFDPTTSGRTFTLALSEYAEAVLAPPLFARLAQEAPDILVAIRHADRTNAGALLESNEAQLAIAMLGEPTALYTRLRLLPEGFMILLRPGHPLLEGEMTTARYVSVPHLLHSSNGSRDGMMDRVLRDLGRTRRLGAVVAHLSAVPGILAQTDMIMTLSGRLARQLSAAHGLILRPLPAELAAANRNTRLSMIFHRRFEADQGHAWLRRLLLALAREVAADCPADALRAARAVADESVAKLERWE